MDTKPKSWSWASIDPHDPRRIEAACEDLFESDPSLAQLAAASTHRRLALGPRAGSRQEMLGVDPPDLPELGTPEARRRSRLCAEADGFNLHAAVSVRDDQRDRLERLCRYLSRPPLADDRLEQLDEDTIAVRFKRPRRDGGTHILLAPASDSAQGPPCPGRRTRIPWATLLERVFGIDPTQCDCGGRYRLVATIRDPRAAAATLRWLAMRAEPERITPARPPPDPDLERDEPGDALQEEFDWAA